MPDVFVDNVHFVAVLSAGDHFHEQALHHESRLASSNAKFVTTDLILAECLAAFSRSEARLRVAAARYVRGIRRIASYEVVPLSAELFERGLDLYEARPDKRYSLADTISMVVCRERGIAEILTADRDFEHEGFQILFQA